MLLKIDFESDQVVIQKKGKNGQRGRLVLRVPKDTNLTALLCTVEGRSAAAFEVNPIIREAHLTVGANGGIKARPCP